MEYHNENNNGAMSAHQHKYKKVILGISIFLCLIIVGGIMYQVISFKKSEKEKMRITPEQQEIVNFYKEHPYKELTDTERKELVEFFEKNKSTQ